MKNQNNKVTAVLFVVALALAPMVQANPHPEGGPGSVSPRNAPTVRARPAAVAKGGSLADRNLRMATIHCTDNVIRGKIGTFVVNVKSALKLGGTYVNFSVSGTAVNGVDYKLLVSPAYISQSGFGVIQIETLNDPRGSAFQQALSVEITLEAGAGYAVGKANSATMWIKPAVEASNQSSN
jgi:hypothetical protein